MKDKIYIKIQNEFLVIGDKVSIPFVWNSPLFDAEILKGSYSYPFNLSLKSETNRRLLGRPDDVKNTEKIKKRIDCILGLFGKEYAAYITISAAGRSESAVCAIFMKDSAVTAARDKSIRSFDLGTIDVSNDSSFKEMHINWASSLSPDVATGLDVNVELNNINYQCSVHALDPITSSSTWTDCLDDLISQINADTAIHNLHASRGPEVTIGDGFPMLKVVSTIPGNDSQVLITKVYDQTPPAFYPFIYFQSTYNNGSVLIEYMNDTVAGIGDQRIVFSPMYFDNLYTDELYLWNHVANYWNGTTFTTQDGDYGVPVIPLPYFKHVCSEIYKNMGYTITGDFFKDPELSELVFFSAKPADNIQPVTIQATYLDPIDIRKVNVYADIIPIAEQLPDMTVSQMINMHRNTLGVYYIFNNEEKYIRIGFLKNVLKKSGYIDWNSKTIYKETVKPLEQTGVTLKYNNDPNDNALKTQIPSIDGYPVKATVATFEDLPTSNNHENDLRLVLEDNSYYRASFVLEMDAYVWQWSFYSVNLYDYVYEGGSLSIESGNSLHMMIIQSKIPMPYFDQKATSVPYNQPALSFTSRLMLYRGMKTHTEGLDTPVTSPTITREADSTEQYSLQWNGEKGLYEQQWKGWLHFLSNSVPVEKLFYLNDSDLNNIVWDEWYRTEGVNYLLKTVKFSVTKSSISVVTAELYAKP